MFRERAHLRICPLRQQGNRGNQTYEQQGNGNQGGYQRLQSSYTQPQNGQYNQAFRGQTEFFTAVKLLRVSSVGHETTLVDKTIGQTNENMVSKAREKRFR